MFYVGDLVFYPQNFTDKSVMMIVKVDSDDHSYQLCDLLGEDGMILREIWSGCLQIVSE